jgi:putative transposase
MGKPGTGVPGEQASYLRVPSRDGTLPDVTSDTDICSKTVDSREMAHKYPNILIHCVFSTKERRALIPQEMLPQLWKYFAGIGRNHGIAVLAAGGISNHSHLLIALPSDMPVAKAVQILFSVSSSNRDAVKNYIEHQAEHHRKRSYESEFEAMLRKSGITFDPREAFG